MNTEITMTLVMEQDWFWVGMAVCVLLDLLVTSWVAVKICKILRRAWLW